MNYALRELKPVFFAGLASFLAINMAGCASVKVSVPGFGGDKDKTVSYSEREALMQATKALSDQPWGEQEESGFVSVLFGTIGESEQDRTLNAYLEQVHKSHFDPVTAVIADADYSLSQARRVAEAGRQAAMSIRPVASDIVALEEAISEARECRKMYVDALKALSDDGHKVAKDDVRDIRDAFTQTIEDIGSTADLVVARMNTEDPVSQVASRENRETSSN